MRGLFFQENPLNHREMRTEREMPLLAKQHKNINMLILDLELLLLVAAVAFIVHSIARMVWPWLKTMATKHRLLAEKKKRTGARPAGPPPPKEPLTGPFPRDLPPPTFSTGVFAKVVHEKLSGPISEQELLPFLQEHLGSFTIANAVHAIVKCGKLQVQPTPVYLALVDKVAGSVSKLKARGLAHVLWGLARVDPKSEKHAKLADELVECLCGKCGELKQSDVVSVIWAVGELRTGEAGFDRVKKVLGCSLKTVQPSLSSTSTEDLVLLLETLASDRLAPPAGETAPAAPLVVTTCTALLAAAKQPPKKTKRRTREDLTLPLPESVKAVLALAHLCRQGSVGTDREPGELLRGLACRVADVRTAKGTQFTTAVDTLSKLRVEDVGLQCFNKLARSAMLLNFQGLSRRHLVKLAVLVAAVAQSDFDCASEFFLELAQQVNGLEPALPPPEAQKVREAFDQVGYASMLNLSA